VLENEHGVVYLALMTALVLMGIALASVSESWRVVVQRDREAELLFRGTRIKQAIEAYAGDYEARKGTRSNIYPERLDQLVEGDKRYLPKVYKDPMTGQDFGLIKVGGEIRGVRSLSMGVPLDSMNFKGARNYNQILFQANPPSPGRSCRPAIHPLNPLLSLGVTECPPSPVPPP
jgi:type II secretory pathway pseudopilin PulG